LTLINHNLDPKVIDHIKLWDWNFIIHYGLNHIGQLKGKGSQYNWLRGDLVEEVIASQDDTLEFVGEHHKDFEWHRYGITLECKSLLNNTMYDRRGKLKSNFKVKLCSLRSKRKIKVNEICDVILVVMKDGSFIIPKNLATHNIIQSGKQVDIIIASNHIIEISGPKNLTRIIQKIDINEKVRKFKRMLIDDARKEYDRLIKSE
jgi:hypothetical protein